MSVLGIHKVLELIKKDKLVENLGARDLSNPEGVGIDLRMGEAHKIVEGGAFIEADPSPSSGQVGLGRRKGVKTEMIAKFHEDSKTQEEIEIKPGEYLLISTIEQINTPKDLMPMVYPRSSLFRAGLLLLVTKTDPGYRGTLTMGLRNLSEFPVKLQMGARVCNIVFYQIEGEGVEYRGQHQGGRISPSEIEQQV
jgi:deoxycytidine triphosphate deaminase